MKYWTDGAATMKKDANDNYVREAGGWSFCYESENGKLKGYYGGLPQTTNNEMELTAIFYALDAAATIPDFDIRIISDSAYCINIFTSWAKNWEKNGWTRGKKHEPIENLALIQKIWTLMSKLEEEGRTLSFEKVKGHSGVKENEIVDKYAVIGKREAAETVSRIFKEFEEA